MFTPQTLRSQAGDPTGQGGAVQTGSRLVLNLQIGESEANRSTNLDTIDTIPDAPPDRADHIDIANGMRSGRRWTRRYCGLPTPARRAGRQARDCPQKFWMLVGSRARAVGR